MTGLGWGFIGASIWARERLVPAVQAAEGADAVGVFSTSADRGQRFATEGGLRQAYGSLDALLTDRDIDVVYISTTNDLHAAQTIAAAAAGKHVLCEKPLATTVSEALQMVEACEQAGVVLATNHHLRGAATIMKIRALIAEGAIGEVLTARIHFCSLLPEAMRTWRLTRPEAGGGVALDLTTHSADTIRFLLADEIVEVSAMTSSGGLGQSVVEDTVVGVMRSATGPLVGFHDSFVTPHATNGVELHGTKASLFADDVLTAEPVGQLWLRHGSQVTPVAVERRWPLYDNAVSRFMAAVRGNGEPLTSGRDGTASLAIALAALESAREGHPVAPAA